MKTQVEELPIAQTSRRDLLFKAIAGTGVAAAALVLPSMAHADGPESVQVAEIHQLQAAFHYAKSTRDIDLMMSLWADDAVLVFTTPAGTTTYTGNDHIRTFLLTTGSFTHRRFSVVPSFKIQVDVKGDEAYLYFECVDIGNYDTAPFVASLLYLKGTVRNNNGNWQFQDMAGGFVPTLSVTHYYP